MRLGGRQQAVEVLGAQARAAGGRGPVPPSREQQAGGRAALALASRYGGGGGGGGPLSSHDEPRVLRLLPVLQVLEILQEGVVLKVPVLRQPCTEERAQGTDELKVGRRVRPGCNRQRKRATGPAAAHS